MCWIFELKETLWNGLLDFLLSLLYLSFLPKHLPDISGKNPAVGRLCYVQERAFKSSSPRPGWAGESSRFRVGPVCVLLGDCQLTHPGLFHFTWTCLFLFISNMVSGYLFTSKILCLSMQS